MSTTMRSCLRAATAGLALLAAHTASAGPIFLTGHDPDFHSQDSVHAQHLLSAGLSYVTGGAYTNTTKKFLWVESFLSPTSGHRVGEDGLNALGLTNGTEYDWVDATGLSTVNFADYEAIAVASSFGGMLTQAELSGLISRKDDIKNFVNAGGGLLALAECAPTSGSCLADTLGPSPSLFGFLPVTVTSVVTTPNYSLTAAGKLLFPSLTDDDMNDPTHNSFGQVGGLTVVDTDSQGIATTLAGNVKITDTGFSVPEPTSLALLGAGIVAAGCGKRRRG